MTNPSEKETATPDHVESCKTNVADKINSNLERLPEEIVLVIENIVCHSCHNDCLQNVLEEFKSFVLYNPDRDVGSNILARMDGMPILI